VKLTPIRINVDDYPAELRSILFGTKLYDSSCSPQAKVIFADKDSGYFLKCAAKGALKDEVAMTRYFYSKGLSANVVDYISADKDWMLTEKIYGDDCTAGKYREQPERLCDIIAERLAILHSMDFADCPVQNHTEKFLATAEENRRADNFDKSHFPDSFGYESPEQVWEVVEFCKHLLRNDVLLHGDYCLPNIILNNREFSGFIDLGNGGVGDRHVDIFWGIWTLYYNLKTNKYRQRFIDAYGRDKVDEDMLRLVAAIEVFG